MSPPLFDPSFRHSLDRLAAAVRRLNVARRRPTVTGAGQSFREHRDYVPGDDTRYIDWSVFGRLGKLVLRVFETEAEPTVYVVVDRSRSMRVGEPPRFDVARRLGVALGYVMLSLNARVGWAAAGEELTDELAPAAGCPSIIRVMDALRHWRPEAATCDWSAVVERLVHGHRRRGLVVLIGDFYDPPDPLETALARLAFAGFATLVLQLVLPEELDPPPRPAARLHDAEGGVRHRMVLSPAVHAAYREVFDERRDALHAMVARRGGAAVSMNCGDDLEQLVLDLFRRRAVQLGWSTGRGGAP